MRFPACVKDTCFIFWLQKKIARPGEKDHYRQTVSPDRILVHAHRRVPVKTVGRNENRRRLQKLVAVETAVAIHHWMITTTMMVKLVIVKNEIWRRHR